MRDGPQSQGARYDIVFVPDLMRVRGADRETKTETDRRILPNGRAVLSVRINGLGGAIRNAADLLVRASDTEHEDAEEVRLFYVACTRARERLILLSSKGRSIGPWQELLAAWGFDAQDPQGDAPIDPGVSVKVCDPAGGTEPASPAAYPIGPLVRKLQLPQGEGKALKPPVLGGRPSGLSRFIPIQMKAPS